MKQMNMTKAKRDADRFRKDLYESIDRKLMAAVPAEIFFQAFFELMLRNGAMTGAVIFFASNSEDETLRKSLSKEVARKVNRSIAKIWNEEAESLGKPFDMDFEGLISDPENAAEGEAESWK